MSANKIQEATMPTETHLEAFPSQELGLDNRAESTTTDKSSEGHNGQATEQPKVRRAPLVSQEVLFAESIPALTADLNQRKRLKTFCEKDVRQREVTAQNARAHAIETREIAQKIDVLAKAAESLAARAESELDHALEATRLAAGRVIEAMDALKKAREREKGQAGTNNAAAAAPADAHANVPTQSARNPPKRGREASATKKGIARPIKRRRK